MGRGPIILAHGIAPFDRILREPSRGPDDRQHYFRGVASHLRAEGFDVEHSDVGFADPVQRRAADLKSEVDRLLAEWQVDRAHIIAHSMGGLDARHMIVDHGMADKVASLTTISTPHLGTSFADLANRFLIRRLLKRLEGVVAQTGFRSLTIGACGKFNVRARHAEATNSVAYRAYFSSQPRRRVFSPLQPSWRYIRRHERRDAYAGANDGLVSVASQQWTPLLAPNGGGLAKRVVQAPFPVNVDHLNAVGWWDPSELRGSGWRRLLPGGNVSQNLEQMKQEYEDRIKAAYAQIAHEATS